MAGAAGSGRGSSWLAVFKWSGGGDDDAPFAPRITEEVEQVVLLSRGIFLQCVRCYWGRKCPQTVV